MTTRYWVGGENDLADQGHWGFGSNWQGGRVPGGGDTAVINGVQAAGLSKIGELYSFPIGGGYTLVDLFQPPSSNLQPLENPYADPGITVADEVIDINGKAGPPQIWLQNTQLINDAINATGLSVWQVNIANVISGSLAIGTQAGPAFVQMQIVGANVQGYSVPGETPATAIQANVTVGDASELQMEAITGSGLPPANIDNYGTFRVDPGGKLIIDDTQSGELGATTYADHNTVVYNDRVFDIVGQGSQITSADFNTDIAGDGGIFVIGNGGQPSATTVTFGGNVSGQHIIVSDAVIQVLDAGLTLGDPTQPGFAVSGGSFTFWKDGVLLLKQPPLTVLQFNSSDTGMIEVPDGQHPFTTPIFGFGPTDVIGLEGEYLGGLTGQSYYTTWNQATHTLTVDTPASLRGNPPDVLAAFTFEGTYAASGFHLSGNSSTELLSLTYTPPAQTAAASAASSGHDALAEALAQSTAAHRVALADPTPAPSVAAVAGAARPAADPALPALAPIHHAHG